MTSTSVNPNHKLATSEFSNAIANDHNYSDADEKLILEIILNFLQKFPYLYDTLNVDFFAKKVYNKLDFEWIRFMKILSVEEFNHLPQRFKEYTECPETLALFFEAALDASILDEISISTTTDYAPHIKNQSDCPPRNVKAKKFHELQLFGNFVMKHCASHGIKRLIDIGCGLGHLCKFLKNAEPVKIEFIGIEADSTICQKGRKIYNDVTIENIRFSVEELLRCHQVILCDDEAKKTALISLHGCGLLQPLIIKEFVKLSKISSSISLLILIGCCYHKIPKWDKHDGINWALSEAVKSALKIRNLKIPITGLRLACQSRLSTLFNTTAAQHKRHEQNFTNRALLECLFAKQGLGSSSSNCAAYPPKNLSRKFGGMNFQDFKNAWISANYSSNEEGDPWGKILDDLYHENRDAIEFIEPFSVLQYATQGPLESLILLDRMLYLKEEGFDASLIPVFDAEISPRNVALVAFSK